MPPKRFPKREVLLFSLCFICFVLDVHFIQLLKKPVGRKPPAVARQNLDIPVVGSSETPDDQIQKTEEELNFCIHQLKLSLNSKKLTPKQST
jgi:hypothetical protein